MGAVTEALQEIEEVRVRVRGHARRPAWTFVLRGPAGECELPLPLAPATLIDRLQQLPGFDNAALIGALASPREGEARCWTAAP